MEKLLIGVGTVVAALLILIFICVALCFPLMWCWNYVMPYLFGFKMITWSQAWCLMFISGILIKHSSTTSKS